MDRRVHRRAHSRGHSARRQLLSARRFALVLPASHQTKRTWQVPANGAFERSRRNPGFSLRHGQAAQHLMGEAKEKMVITRKAEFSASHVCRIDSLSDAEN